METISVVRTQMKLVIFDLDQTLVDFISIHHEVTRKLFRRYFSVDARLTDIDFAGKSLTETIPEDASMYILPGVKELLEELSKTNHIIALYTGGSPGVVHHVFSTIHLGQYFRFCLRR